MSFIDCFGHEYVASFAGLPVYHPLQHITGEFEAEPDTLLVGGGSGEHPALIIQSLEHVAGWHISCLLEEFLDEETCGAIIERSETLRQRAPECLKFANWSVQDFADFHQRCMSATLQQPYSQQEHGSLETWLLFHFGKLICLSMPDLVPQLETDLAEAWSAVASFEGPLSNFFCAPPGFPIPGGRAVQGPLNVPLSAWKQSRRSFAN